MKWTVTYRNNSGAQDTLVLEAADRKELFAELEKRGLSAIKIAEGETRTTARRKPRPSGSSPLFKFLIVAFVVIVGAMAAWVLIPQSNESTLERRDKAKKNLIAETDPAAPSQEPREQAPAAVQTPPPPPPSNIYTNREGHEVHVEKDGTKTIISSAWARRLKEQKENPPKRLFRHTSEGYLAMFLNPAVSVPPPPENYTDDQVMAMLTDKIEIAEDDTEDEIRQKEGVAQMKEELRQWIKDGGTFNTYLAELQHRQDLEAAQMFDARNMITEAMENGDVNEARALYDKINEHFASKFMPKVNVAPKYRKLLEERE